MAKGSPIADLIVRRDWWMKSVMKLLKPYPPGAGEFHRVRGPLIDQDYNGIWLGEVPSNLVHLKKPDQPVYMRLFIPWGQVVALGLIDDPARLKAGFSAGPLEAEPTIGP